MKDYTEEELKLQHLEYLKANFSNGDYLAINDVLRRPTTSVSIEHAAKNMSMFIAVNPIKKGTNRAQANVAKKTGWLLEADKEYLDFNTPLTDENGKEVTVSIEKQKKIIEESGIPFATLVYSGSKSIHIVPRITEDLTEENWKAIWNAFAHTLWKYGLRVDPQTCDTARWTRRPGVLREDTNKYQTLDAVGKKCTLEDLESWFKSNMIDWKDYLENDKADKYINWNADSLPIFDDAHNAVTRYMFKGRTFGSESRAMDAFRYFKCMRGAGMSKDESLSKALQEWGNVSSRDHASTQSIIVNECNNVWNKSSVPAFAVSSIQKLDIASHVVPETTPDIDIDEIIDSIDNVVEVQPDVPDKPRKEVFFRNINNYILMNNDIMRLDYKDSDRLNQSKITDRTWKKKLLFTDQDFLALEEFDGYVNEPNILDYKRKVFGSKWNVFNPISHDIKKGPWPHIEKLINHIFGDNGFDHDQREECYDRHTVLIKNPKYKQQALVLYSKEQGTAKSSLALLESLLVGESNFAKIKNDELEATFNAIWVHSLIINLDEPNFDNKKKMTKVIREMVTAPKQNLRKMQTEYEAVDFHAKLIMTTNDSDFMVFEKDDRRYWVRRAPVIPENQKNNNFDDKLRLEVGHYIHFLLHERKMLYPEPADTTFWLPREIIKTNSFQNVCKDNEDVLVQAINDIFESAFLEDKERHTIVFKQADLIAILREKKKDYTDLNIDKVANGQLVNTLRDVICADNSDNKPSRLKEDEYDLSVLSRLENQMGKKKTLQRYWRVYRTQYNLEDAVFDKLVVK